jgi:hypothetical protein
VAVEGHAGAHRHTVHIPAWGREWGMQVGMGIHPYHTNAGIMKIIFDPGNGSYGVAVIAGNDQRKFLIPEAFAYVAKVSAVPH